MSYLLDTCVISELVRPLPDEKVVAWIGSCDEFDLFLSVMTIGEIQKGIEKVSPGKRKNRLSAWLKEELEIRFAERLLHVTDQVALTWGMMLGNAEKNGQPLSATDALIAATAAAHDLVLVTRNIRDFEGCSIDIFNPWITA